jgi:enoyl-CoA hydratase/carnithine racemase
MLELTVQAGVATLAIRRAEKKNAFTTAMWAALGEHCAALAASAAAREPGAARVLLLQGEPGAFCAGADIEEMSTLVADAAALAENNRIVMQAQLALERLPLPTIALIDGPCFGGGFGIAAACDFRLGTARAQFAVTPARLGLLYSRPDAARLVRLVGDARARRLLLRGERIDADTALAWGVLDELLHDSAALHSTATQWATELAQASRTAMAGLKATLAELADPHEAEAEAVRRLYDAAFTGPDFAEGAAAFLAKRAPRFG